MTRAVGAVTIARRVVHALCPVSVLLTLAACAGIGGEWPSLKTPAESAASTNGAPATGVAAPPAATLAGSLQSGTATLPAPAVSPENAAALAAVRARLDEAGRQIETVDKRWTEQSGAFQTAASAAAGAQTGDSAWATAQKALTRLNQVAAQYGDIEDTLLRASGELATIAADGADTGPVLGQAGRLLRTCRAARASALEAVQKGQTLIQR